MLCLLDVLSRNYKMFYCFTTKVSQTQFGYAITQPVNLSFLEIDRLDLVFVEVTDHGLKIQP